MLKGIVARNKRGAIGKDGKMMWRSKNDFKHFKKTTMGAILIVGKKTFEEDLGGNPLPGRLMFIVGTGYMTPWQALEAATLESFDRNRYNAIAQSQVFNSTLMMVQPGPLQNEDIWIIGGGVMYEIFGSLVQEFHISNIIDNDDEGDTYFELPKHFRGKVFEYEFTCVA